MRYSICHARCASEGSVRSGVPMLAVPTGTSEAVRPLMVSRHRCVVGSVVQCTACMPWQATGCATPCQQHDHEGMAGVAGVAWRAWHGCRDASACIWVPANVARANPIYRTQPSPQPTTTRTQLRTHTHTRTHGRAPTHTNTHRYARNARNAHARNAATLVQTYTHTERGAHLLCSRHLGCPRLASRRCHGPPMRPCGRCKGQGVNRETTGWGKPKKKKRCNASCARGLHGLPGTLHGIYAL